MKFDKIVWACGGCAAIWPTKVSIGQTILLDEGKFHVWDDQICGPILAYISSSK